MTSMPCRLNSRLMVLMALSWPSQIGTAVRMRIGRTRVAVNPRFNDSECVTFAETRRTFLFPPWGEGGGEGDEAGLPPDAATIGEKPCPDFFVSCVRVAFIQTRPKPNPEFHGRQRGRRV